jgi:hypothetical protein
MIPSLPVPIVRVSLIDGLIQRRRQRTVQLTACDRTIVPG